MPIKCVMQITETESKTAYDFLLDFFLNFITGVNDFFM